MNFDSESSIDGSLEDIFPAKTSGTTAVDGLRGAFSESKNDVGAGEDESMLFEDFGEAPHEGKSDVQPVNSLHSLLPSCQKLTSLFGEYGYNPVSLTLSDINISSRTISVFVVDAWADSILSISTEILEQNKFREYAVHAASMSASREVVSNAALEDRVNDLQSKLFDCERKLKSSEANRDNLEDEKRQAIKRTKEVEHELKQLAKNFEGQLQEGERRVRQKEQELERLKGKLQQLTVKERSVKEKHKSSLDHLARGDVDVSSHSRSPITTKPGTTPIKGKGSPHASSSSSLSSASAQDVIEALEAQRDNLKARNAELQLQVNQLAASLKDFQNGLFDASSASEKQKSRLQPAAIDEVLEDEMESLKEMYDKINAQKRRIEQLEHRCEQFKTQGDQYEDQFRLMRQKGTEMRDEIENLRLELDNRPTMRQWSQKLRECQDLEDKLHDLVMMRGEASEIAAWRQHLSTRDRVKVDKRNYELGLWLLDSLPKAVAKEILQAVCRELDVSDVSEVQGAIVKLKAVVQTVPRMEKFISQVCAYIFQRDRVILSSCETVDSHGRRVSLNQTPAMEDVLPALKRWWVIVQRCDCLEEFSNNIFRELLRREKLLTCVKFPVSDEELDQLDRELEDSKFEGRNLWANRDMVKAVELLRDMSDFQVEVLRHNKSFQAAENYVRGRPEELCNRLLSHLQYLFQVPTLEGLLPRLNQIYIFNEEMKNFLSIMRELMGFSSGVGAISDKNLLTEIQNLVGLR